MHYLNEKDLENLKKLDTPTSILKETLIKHFPEFDANYYLNELYTDLALHILRGNGGSED